MSREREGGREGGSAEAEETKWQQQGTFDKFCIFTIVLLNCFAKLGCREGSTEFVQLFG